MAAESAAPERALRTLRVAATSHERAETARRSSMERLREAIVEADRAGASRAAIIRASGLARQTVYDTLGRER